MSKVRVICAGLLAAAAMVGGNGPVAAAAESPAAAPLRVKIAPETGKKVKVARELRVVTSCSRDCALKIRVRLITPVGNSTVKGGQKLAAGQLWITGMVLTRYGFRTVRAHFRRSRLRVAIRARDIETGTVIRKTRTFRLRR